MQLWPRARPCSRGVSSRILSNGGGTRGGGSGGDGAVIPMAEVVAVEVVVVRAAVAMMMAVVVREVAAMVRVEEARVRELITGTEATPTAVVVAQDMHQGREEVEATEHT